MYKILIIEDDMWILSSLDLYFKESSFDVKLCDNWTEAIATFYSYMPDIVILDINLPWRDWISIAEEIREKENTPIIMLSARWREEDKVKALDLWADDYVSKPFSPRELLARVKSVLKRSQPSSSSQTWRLVFNTIELDTKTFEIFVSWAVLKATKTEYLLLKYMIEHKDEVISRESIMKEIMWYDNYLYDRTIDTHVKNLRKKLWDAMNIETLRWVWYRIS